MATVIHTPSRWRKRLIRFCITAFLMGASFAVGVTLTVVVAARLLLPIAATGMTMGLAGLSLASVHGTITVLQTGDSETRLATLTQLKSAFETQTPRTIDPQVVSLLMPALNQCSKDKNPDVVMLASELVAFVNANELPQEQ